MSSDDEEGNLMASFKRGGRTRSIPRKQAPLSPGDFVSSDESSAHDEAPARTGASTTVRKVAVAVRVRPVRNVEEYTYYEPAEEIERINREYGKSGQMMYEVVLSTGQTRQISFDDLLATEGGSSALQNFQVDEVSPSEGDMFESPAPEAKRGLRRNRTKTGEDGFINSAIIDLSDEDSSRRPRQRRRHALSRGTTDTSRSRTYTRKSKAFTSDSSEESEAAPRRRGRRPKRKVQEPVRRSGRVRVQPQDFDEEDEEDEDEDSSGVDILRSDVLPGRRRKRKRGLDASFTRKIPRVGVRQSDRATRAQNNMQEADVNDIYRSDSETPQTVAQKVVSVREVFQTLPRSNLFRSRHVEGCEVCSEGPTIAPLIYCQGCSLAYHKNCLGNRGTRDHLVTKIGDENFVLQCKRCINFYKRKDPTAPDLAKCSDCHKPGPACRPFRERKSPLQEQKERDDNGGQDPIVDVPPNLINNAANVLFRCTRCSRAYHYHHLPPLSPYAMVTDRDEDETADERFQEYARTWRCKECNDTKDLKVGGLIAWRPSDVETYQPGTSCEMLSEDEKQYLIKWENQSYFRAAWHSGAWTWGVTAPAMRKAFNKREDGPKMRTEDAIPEEFLRIDIVLDVKYTSYVEVQKEEIDKARIKEVDKALIKYKGLGYEDAVWEKVPTPEDGERWLDFVTAYNDWVAGRYIRYPKQGHLKARLDKARATPFAKLEKEKQPDNLVGGELMKYQIEGLNWIYYQWYCQKNGILADEMGLGKTIQVIGFMATLIQDHNCFPFLVVVPNSTCANWRREIKQWAPSLRVVTFFGSATARDMAYKYEMFPQGTKELRAHVVVTSYEAATDDSCRKVFRGVNWAGLIVDEGQRLKNDRSQIYGALQAVKAPFRLLLTGTPLQNNARELFNLLQFLDDTINAAELEEKYAEMTTENIRELHEQIRPFILRRTKAQVLTFLPPLGQIIVPLSMSVLQKKLYKSILAKNPELLKALFMTQRSLKQQEKANLSNILMQLRKCLCHPFVYSREIEERTDIQAISHRNLVEASAKLQLLELLLPKLQQRGHRVLIFSQFLDMLSIIEDFLDGMQMAYQRLDGTMGSLEKQKRIDQFNAPDSPLFAFLLSTRAGGVGINLATADTVIILDPDFNPHQDIQAISRAHRIGQKKKVLCFQLMTRSSVEEKIVQIGRKKMALDHVVVEQLDAEDLEDKDLESILRHGAAELFQDDGADHDIRYDEASIEKLLDRSQIENTKTGADDSADSQFSFARVWANDQGALEDTLDTTDEVVAPDPGVWDKILKERQAAAAAEALARAEALGRGKRARMNVRYDTEQDATAEAADGPSPARVEKTKKLKKKRESAESDTDFQLYSDEQPEESASELEAEAEPENINDLNRPPQPKSTYSSLYKQNGSVKPFERVHLPVRSTLEPQFGRWKEQVCIACHQTHALGACPLKIAGVEHCGLCGLAHFGHARTCPHIKSETQVRDMLEALKNSPEDKRLIEAAAKYLRGVKGTLVQQKKRDREKAMMLAAGGGGAVPGAGLTRPPQQQQQQPAAGGYQRYEQHGNPPSYMGPPQREVPNTAAGGPIPVVPGSVGSHIQGQRNGFQQQQQQQQQRRAQQVQDRDRDDHAVESALRGFLGK
ncbi:uncharacterized protein EI97DRAFT_434949 [Westerdykella ornata]|uniref:Chromatin remodeling complex subunit n=1 Tax=Westerdykella ornata TaxID=318751 RepID=A0A6A6JEX0_WESOR|nr:uncharacterized protein EI97DRAFT_434949 [Westerdykella ornata]KAF2274723.1 hypothetical protein EI97DRAFT_434949 [Westerdykella ornata]